MNKVILIGRVGSGLDLKQLTDNQVVRFSLATSEKYKDKQGNIQENTEWHNIVCWGKQAEILSKFVKKGDRLGLEGKIKYSNYEKEGQKMYKTDIQIISFELLGSKAEKSEQNYNQPDDLPF